MHGALDEIRSRGANLVFVGSGAPHFASAFREEYGIGCPVLSDPDLQSYRALDARRGVVEALSPRLLGNAFRALRGGARQGTVQGDAWQLGGVFVIRPGGRVSYAYRSREAGDHPPVEELLEALDA